MRSLAFSTHRGGIGTTTLIYHLAHMWVDQGKRVLLVDLDPQAALTAMCLDEGQLEALWTARPGARSTIDDAIRPLLLASGDLAAPTLHDTREGLALVAGDLALSAFEPALSWAWVEAIIHGLRREAAHRHLCAFSRVIDQAALDHQADLVLVDTGPQLGAINRAALLAVDHVITPLSPDVFSVEGLAHLGDTLKTWRRQWQERVDVSPTLAFAGTRGAMSPAGYLVMQTGIRLNRPATTYQRWLAQIPRRYHEALLDEASTVEDPRSDPACLGVVHEQQSLMPLALDARKPVFHLRPADGAIGARMDAVHRCRTDYDALAERIAARLNGVAQARPPTG